MWAVGQVRHVDVVADTGAVRRRVVLAEDREWPSAAHGRKRQGYQVLLRIVILAEQPVRVGAGRVEVPQDHPAHARRALDVRERPLDRELRLAVGVDRAAEDALR